MWRRPQTLAWPNKDFGHSTGVIARIHSRTESVLALADSQIALCVRGVGLQDIGQSLTDKLGNMQAALELCLRKQSFSRNITVRYSTMHIAVLGPYSVKYFGKGPRH